MIDRIPHDVAALAPRNFPAMGFWQFGRTKVDRLFSMNDPT
jgi:hypothetical protein